MIINLSHYNETVKISDSDIIPLSPSSGQKKMQHVTHFVNLFLRHFRTATVSLLKY